ncbi:hypothetical protein A0256_22925 [Mucilaginibacter sp. PAMC 26640]|nr:hypothetical protein A0256_22925 [Mucilaginibacter sp. PAMC 26640]
MSKRTYRSWFYNLTPLLIWLLLQLFILVSFPGNIPGSLRYRILMHMVTSNTLLLGLFYAHTYLLYPLLKNRRWLAYLPLLLALLAGYLLCWWLMRDFKPHPQGFTLPNGGTLPGTTPPPFREGPALFFPVFPPFIALLSSFCFRIILDNQARLHAAKERETVHLRTELNFLRSQINPHFLFNVLNNLTALARRRSDKVETAIVNLSQLMRYMLYESDDNLVPLDKELAYLNSYIQLQLLRFGDEVTVKVNFEDDYKDFSIGPMLLISLVENAFKHGTDTSGETTIYISLKKIQDSNTFSFSVINDVVHYTRATEEQTGIGLKNLKRRLDILYPGLHNLIIDNNGKVFSSELNIELA